MKTRDDLLDVIGKVHDLLRADDRYGALACLPYGGVECERLVEEAVDLLRAALDLSPVRTPPEPESIGSTNTFNGA